MHNNNDSATKLPYKIGVFGVVLILLWIGVFKFTPTEAKAIAPLVMNHPLMGWLYSVFSEQTVSNLVGISEIIVAIGLIVSFYNAKIGYYSGIAASVIFIVTLSFMLTTPGTWKVVDGVLTTNFFLAKDFVFLAVALWVADHNKQILNAAD